jgi:hypothetical protein
LNPAGTVQRVTEPFSKDGRHDYGDGQDKDRNAPVSHREDEKSAAEE